jgi:hypothetical protein
MLSFRTALVRSILFRIDSERRVDDISHAMLPISGAGALMERLALSFCGSVSRRSASGEPTFHFLTVVTNSAVGYSYVSWTLLTVSPLLKSARRYVQKFRKFVRRHHFLLHRSCSVVSVIRHNTTDMRRGEVILSGTWKTNGLRLLRADFVH